MQQRPSVLCLMFMMQLRKLKVIEQERKENDRLQGVISEMDYDRIAWAASTSRPRSAASRPAAAVSAPLPWHGRGDRQTWHRRGEGPRCTMQGVLQITKESQVILDKSWIMLMMQLRDESLVHSD